MTPGLQLPESVRNAIESESTLNLTRRRKKRQIENGIPINNVSSVMFFFNIRLDNVRTEENVNIPVDIFVNPNIFPFPERIVHQPFWPISDTKFEIKVSCFLFLELFLRKRYFFRLVILELPGYPKRLPFTYLPHPNHQNMGQPQNTRKAVVCFYLKLSTIMVMFFAIFVNFLLKLYFILYYTGKKSH